MTPEAPVDHAWTRYWRGARGGAIDLGAADPVALALQSHWVRQAEAGVLVSPIVDVGSGPAVLLQALRRRTPDAVAGSHWICIDRAAIDLGEGGQPADVRVDGCAPADFATLAPPSGPARTLVSNFGLEYVEREAVAAACERWLVPGGRLDCVLHARDSVIDGQSAEALQDIPLALDEIGLYRKASALLQALASLPADPAARAGHALDVRQSYNAAVDRLKSLMEQRGRRSASWIDMLTHVTTLARATTAATLDTALQSLLEHEQGLRDECVRLLAMRRSALDHAQMDRLLRDLGQHGFGQLQALPLDSPVGLVGWRLSGLRG